MHTLNKAISVLSASKDLKAYFKCEIDELKVRRLQWESGGFRVGLIGITSSGKSTLINALFGQAMLPTGVPPSSNNLVICRRNSKLRSLVYYTDKSPKTIVDNIPQHLLKLVDERQNRNNRENVKEVLLEGPDFLLESGTTLVDTPGLDAHGFDQHEKLTMDLFLPTVDMVVFTTTAKANSDDQIKDRLERIAAAGKPLLMVQTMIESVEPKLGRGGTISKKRSVVQEEHRLRLKKLLSACRSDSIRQSPIFQVSAKKALSGDLVGSGLRQMAAAIHTQLAQLKSSIHSGRLKQLFDILNRMVGIESELSGPSQNEKTLSAEEARLSGIRDELDQAVKELKEQLHQNLSTARGQKTRFENLAANIEASDVSSAEKLIAAIRRWQTAVPKALRRINSEAREALAAPSGALDLNQNDFRITDSQPVHQKRSLQGYINEETSTSIREKPGIWNAIKRFFGGDTGWETVIVKRQKVDIARLKRQVAAAVSYEVEWVKRSVDEILASLDGPVQKIREHLARRESALADKRAKILQMQDRAAVIQRIGRLMESLKPHMEHFSTCAREKGSGYAPHEDGWVEIQVPAYVPSMLSLSSLIREKGFISAREALLSRCGGAPANAIIWGWDQHSMDNFCVRFWPDYQWSGASRDQRIRTIHGPGRASAVTIVNETKIIEGKRDAKFFLTGILPVAGAMFLLIDITQIGATQSQLARSCYPHFVDSRTRLFLVPQSVAELSDANTLFEGLWQCVQIAKTLNGNCSGMLINDSRLSLTVLADMLLRNGNGLTTHLDELEWKDRLSPLIPVHGGTATLVTELLRSWRNAASAGRRPTGNAGGR